MGKLIATRISDEAYSKMLAKCAGLVCSPYEYLKMLVETDLARPVSIESKKTEDGTKYLTIVKDQPKLITFVKPQAKTIEIVRKE